MVQAHLFAVDQRERETVRGEGPQLLHQVQGQRRFPGAQPVQEPDVGVQPDLLTRTVHHRPCQAIQKGQQRIGGVRGWPLHPAREIDTGVRAQHESEGFEVDAGRVALHPEHRLHILGIGQAVHGFGECLGDLAQPRLVLGRIPSPAQDDLTAVLHLARDTGLRDPQTRCGVGVGQVLGVAQQDVAACGPVGAVEEPASSAHPHDGAAILGTARHQLGADLNVAHHHDRFQPAQRQHMALWGVGDDDADRVVLQMQGRSRGLDVEGVEEFSHPSPSRVPGRTTLPEVWRTSCGWPGPWACR